jgi:hypothetical protein
MKNIRLAVVFAALSVARAAWQAPSDNTASDQTKTGTVCVLPNSPNPPTRISPGGEYNPATLTISIDQRPPTSWPHKQKIKIDGLTLNERHRIVLRSDGKRIQSFWFRFSDYRDSTLCVYFDGYQGVQFGDKYTTFWCRCK